MLLSLSTTHRPATDLGFLLHKHPERAQTFTLPFGTAHVLYPEASEARCTAVLLLDIDPVGLTRRGGRSPFALAEYVNDRPYVASSLMSVALVTVFKTAMEGKAPELAQTPIPLTAELPAVPARGGEELVRKLFEPLGYDVDACATSAAAATSGSRSSRRRGSPSCSGTCTCCSPSWTTRSTTGSTRPRSRS